MPIAAAITWFHSVVNSPIREAMATEMARTFSELVKTRTGALVFQAVRNPVLTVALTAGPASGRMMPRDAR